MLSTIIDNAASLIGFLDSLPDLENRSTVLYIDLEGNNLSRQGSLSLVNILVPSHSKVYLVDTTTLGELAFTTTSSKLRTLHAILESEEVTKVFFDVRNDSDALFSLHGVKLRGVEDLQLMELASRRFSKRCVNGLAKCIEQDSGLSWAEKRDWRGVKEKGRDLFDLKRGGNYAVFDRRPLLPDLLQYCTEDVVHMPHLRAVYRQKLCDAWWSKIVLETQARIQLSQSRGYNGHGRHMVLGPLNWQGWQPAPHEMGVRTMLQDLPIPMVGASSVDSDLSGPDKSHGISTLMGTLALHRRAPMSPHDSDTDPGSLSSER